MWKWLHVGVVSALLLPSALLVANFFIGREFKWDAIYTYREREHFRFGQYDLSLKRDGIEFVRDENFRSHTGELFMVERSLLGVEFWNYEDHITCGGSGASSLRIIVSSWTLIFFTACYPIIFLILSYRRRVNRDALQPCFRCGYDLQGNASGTCPECGTSIAPLNKLEIEG